MCGILGYIGGGEAVAVLQSGLKKLNYRGYDSWGLGLKTKNKIEIIKNIGDFEQLKNLPKIKSNCGISHSRWATTGEVSKENAHPHTTENNKIAIVHNGIIENFHELKTELLNKGHKFKSETDTEIICHLIEEYPEIEFPEAVRKAFLRLKGRNAIVVLNQDLDKLIGVKNGSPLIVGIKNNCDGDEYFIASDFRAFADKTKNAIFLDDNELAVLN